MGEHNGSNGSVNGNGAAKWPSPSAAEAANGHEANGVPAPGSPPASSAPVSNAIEYYILCPQRPTDVPGLITHLISRDICEKRQSENYHKCPNCVRSRLWRERNGLPVEPVHAAVAE